MKTEKEKARLDRQQQLAAFYAAIMPLLVITSGLVAIEILVLTKAKDSGGNFIGLVIGAAMACLLADLIVHMLGSHPIVVIAIVVATAILVAILDRRSVLLWSIVLGMVVNAVLFIVLGRHWFEAYLSNTLATVATIGLYVWRSHQTFAGIIATVGVTVSSGRAIAFLCCLGFSAAGGVLSGLAEQAIQKALDTVSGRILKTIITVSSPKKNDAE